METRSSHKCLISSSSVSVSAQGKVKKKIDEEMRKEIVV